MTVKRKNNASYSFGGVMMSVRLTRQQMSEKYPNQWIGINNITYADGGGRQIESADVIFVDKTASELGMMSLNGEDVFPLFTTPDDVFLFGVMGGAK